MEDPYEVLGLPAGVTLDEVRSRYRELAAKYHPDRGADSWIFKQVHEAYEQICAESSGTADSSTAEWAQKPSSPETHQAVDTPVGGAANTQGSPTPSEVSLDVPTLVAGALLGGLAAGICASALGLQWLITVPIGAILGVLIAFVQQPAGRR